MAFTSLAFAAFLPTVLLARWGSPRLSLRLLLVASFVFYGVGSAWFLPMLIPLMLVNYGLGLLIAWTSHKRLALVAALAVNLGVLAYFKYGGWLASSGGSLFGAKADDPIPIVAPLAISFFTFEFVHYAVDVYRGHRPVRNLLHFVLFGAFFPSQISGPIKRYQQFVPQIAAAPAMSAEDVWEGAGLITRGYLKKVVFADNLGSLSELAFGSTARLGDLGSIETLIAVYAFAWQIYFDFSGYTDIARGVSTWLGFRLPENFASPYTSTSIREFWRRWHISLSTWLRDYLYIPLGGSRVPRWRVPLNLMVTMTLGGLWHGAGPQFIVWGAYHGVLLVVARVLGSWERIVPLRRMPGGRVLCAIATFHLVALGWIFFRAQGVTEAFDIIQHVVSGPLIANSSSFGDQHRVPLFLLAAGAAGSLLARRWDPFALGTLRARGYRPALLVLAVLALFIFAPQVRAPFIYFQF